MIFAIPALLIGVALCTRGLCALRSPNLVENGHIVGFVLGVILITASTIHIVELLVRH